MEKIGEIAKRSLTRKSETSLQESCHNEIAKRYGSKEQFLYSFSPDKVSGYVKKEEWCLTGTAPSLKNVGLTYGENIAESWIIAQLWNIAKQTDFEKPTTYQIESVAGHILRDHSNYKVTELMVFFDKFAGGKWGKPYFGNILPTLTKEWVAYRRMRLTKIENEKETEKIREYQEDIQSGCLMNYKQYQNYKQNELKRKEAEQKCCNSSKGKQD